jgi:hypothetical protein
MTQVNQRLVIVPRMDEGYTLINGGLNTIQLQQFSASVWYPGSNVRYATYAELVTDAMGIAGATGLLIRGQLYPWKHRTTFPLRELESLVDRLHETVLWREKPEGDLETRLCDGVTTRHGLLSTWDLSL